MYPYRTVLLSLQSTVRAIFLPICQFGSGWDSLVSRSHTLGLGYLASWN